MQLMNDVIDYRVITKRGVLPVSKLNIGDYVYDFITGNAIEVNGIEKTEKTDAYIVTYTDKRSMQLLNSDKMFTGELVMPLDDIIVKINLAAGINTIFVPLIQHRLEFDKNTVKAPIVNPDPYTAGIFYAYGDFNDKYANLPITLHEAERMFLDQYNYRLNGLGGAGRVYFCRPNTDYPLLWEELFADGFQYELWYDKEVRVARDIPDRFVYGTVKERIQFISGIFDAGFQPEFFEDSVGIVGNNTHILQEVQKMLWSLGVISTVTFDPNLHIFNGIDYKLQIFKSEEKFPIFLYNIDKINRVLDQSNIMGKGDAILPIIPQKISKVGKAYSYNVILDKPNRLFLTANYLPKVSI